MTGACLVGLLITDTVQVNKRPIQYLNSLYNVNYKIVSPPWDKSDEKII